MHTYKRLIEFLQLASEKQQLKFHTARTRITAIKRLFESSKFEMTDILEIDVDALTEAFKENNNISEDTISTYKSRFISARKDYIKFVLLGENLPETEQEGKTLVQKKSQEMTFHPSVIDLPCIIGRHGHVVTIKNLPTDLSKSELNKLTALLEQFVESGEE
jgi:hypothetical protein